jgi:hypothetical protein
LSLCAQAASTKPATLSAMKRVVDRMIIPRVYEYRADIMPFCGLLRCGNTQVGHQRPRQENT